MGVSPFITSSIGISFALGAFPELRRWRKEAGAAGHDVIGQLARRVGLACSLLQALYTAFSIRHLASAALAALPLPTYLALTVLPLAAGTSAMMWMAEEVTRVGIGQGTSVVISLAIIGAYASYARAHLPAALAAGSLGWGPAAALAAVLAQTAVAVACCEGVRRVPIVFFQLQSGGVASAAALEGDHIPFRTNPTLTQPVLFAVCLLDGLPWALGALGAPGALQAGLGALLSPDGALYYALYFAVVFAFSIIDLDDTPTEVADYMLRVGARIPDVRPGDSTVAYLRQTQLFARAWGGLLLGSLSTVAMLCDKLLQARLGLSLGLTSVLLITGTVLQMRRQVRAFRQKPALQKSLRLL